MVLISVLLADLYNGAKVLVPKLKFQGQAYWTPPSDNWWLHHHSGSLFVFCGTGDREVNRQVAHIELNQGMLCKLFLLHLVLYKQVPVASLPFGSKP